ncbi:hypothetical protein [Haliscomenobacter hydrossis]|uniref:Uncharacterized protein n=1 Tax=Haliscomenobacter hydrossis (strain ATCC 27775 / DSM 1100 / LMG 10767 / O) TaxID=760192 RepID=F4L4Z6_HALH1|nr:hypothetical protein [Haliscomenobacter hydrossis]AEE54058.1 hypothetical protein Halhy_6238 [Haliscomenobacter hydrossis DSM 1100]
MRSWLVFWRFAAISTFILLLFVTFWRFGGKPEAPRNPPVPAVNDQAIPDQDNTTMQIDTVDEVEKRKEYLREFWDKMVRIDLLSYKPRDFGGINNVVIKVRNHMEFDAELILVEVKYILANGKVWKTLTVPVHNIPANGQSPRIQIADSPRGKTLQMKPIGIVCKGIGIEQELRK